MSDVKIPPVPPVGWISAPLNEVCVKIVGGGTPSRDHPEFFGGSVIWLTPTEVPKTKIIPLKDSKEKITEAGLQNSSARIIPKDSVLLTSRASIGYVAIAGCDLTTNQGFASFTCSDAIVNYYLAYWLSSMKNVLEVEATGTTFKEISKSKLKEYFVPLPPLSEQHRIVAKIEELFTQLDAGIRELNQSLTLLKNYRQSVLKAAVTGRLSKQWRAEHPDIEPASLLLERIKEERKANLKQQVQCKYPDYLLDETNLPKIPSSWIWVKMGRLTDLSSGKAFLKDEYSEEGIRLLQIANVSFGKIIWDVVTYLPTDYLKKYPDLTLKSGDMLIALNRPVLDGKLKIGVLKESDIPAILYQRVGRFDLFEPITRDYIYYFAQSPFFIRIFNKSLQGIEIPFINKPVLLNINISLPPLQEQSFIVTEIERRFSVIDEMEKTIKQSITGAERLRQSILKRAFEGNLVPQDPSDDPANILLERIKTERELSTPPKKQTRKRKNPSKVAHGN